MTTSNVKLRAMMLATVVAFSMLVAPVSFSPTGMAVAANAGNTAGNVAFSINAAGNQATVSVDDSDLNTDSSSVQTHLVNVESDSESPAATVMTSADTPDGKTQVQTISKGWKVADSNHDGSITAADFTLAGAMDESIVSVAGNSGGYDVTIRDAGGPDDGFREQIEYDQLRQASTSTDTSDTQSVTVTTSFPVGDRDGDGDLDTDDFTLRYSASDESITSISRNSDGTVDVTITDSGGTPDGSETNTGGEQVSYLPTESVRLTETGTDTGKFTGTTDIVQSAQSDTAGVLFAQGGDITRAIYWDQGRGRTIATDALGDSGSPNPALQLFPLSVTKGQNAYLDATGSTDDLQIKTYEWDVDGDGTYELSSSSVGFKQYAFSSTGTQQVTLRVTDYAGNTATVTKSVDVKEKASVKSTSVEHTGNGTAPSGTINVKTRNAGGMLKFHLYRGSDPKNRDLSAAGVDESTELWVNVTMSNYSPDAMMGGAKVDSWTTSTTKGGNTKLSVKMHPIRMQRLSSVTAESPGRWPAQNKQADQAITPGAHLATFDMPDGTTFEQDMRGATLTSDAQVFSPPRYDKETKTLTYSVAAPHWNKTGSKVDSNTNRGFYEATIPQGMVSQMGIENPDELVVTSTDNGQTSNLRNTQVTETSSGGIHLLVNDIHYSSPDLNLQPDSTAPTASAGSDTTVDEDTSLSFDGTGSSDNGKIQTYEWDWNDDGTYDATGSNPTHSFAQPGSYMVTLRVTDGAGNTDTDTLSVTVNNVDDGSSSSDSDSSTPKPTSTATPSAPGTDSDSSTAEVTETAPSTPVATATPAAPATADPATATATASSETDTAGDGSSDADGSQPDAQGTAGGSGPGFGPLAALLALVAAVLVARRR